MTSLPVELADLKHLAKLTISHCPRLTAAGLPDLSSLPLLRDVRANNLPRLVSLPAHLSTWGTGSLSLVGKKDVPGDGLEVLDLGNCSLPLAAIKPFVAKLKTSTSAPAFPHLRSLTLSSNPLCLEAESYAVQLQDSAQLPKLQIIDTRRLVERKRAGMLPESKRDRKARERAEGKRRPTGANVDTSARKMRTWGAADGDEQPEADRQEAGEGEEPPSAQPREDKMDVEAAHEPEAEDGGKKKRKRKRTKGNPAEPEPEAEDAKRPVKKLRDEPAKATAKVSVKETVKESRQGSKDTGKPAKKGKPGKDQAAAAAIVADPTVAKASKPSRSETAVVGVVDVQKKKDGGVDLAAMLKGDTGSSLGVGGW